MLIKTKTELKESVVTDYALYQRRRDFLKMAGFALTGTGFPALAPAGLKLPDYQPDADNTLKNQLTEEIKVTSYNNFYELGTAKDDPLRNAHKLKTEPWAITVEGECAVSYTHLTLPTKASV